MPQLYLGSFLREQGHVVENDLWSQEMVDSASDNRLFPAQLKEVHWNINGEYV